mmetsp:Transcript_6982/g.11247  ORF Transcript_6982/g.11247 Transcript_6982/m.11247 type:complete len:80 (-) Transcript_6982:894-1133(-)|eukprot:CAMPEP_0183782670 /NCGR_PEP_ID=MMETSP0739-20130205/61578_1 /TAXON_ID=385413 /ORGANISM="Thalassiosira miniscula, Strain CCMP1093" /LENGTH=79 /DNA_ID=CAMNT_0026026151 /DNA_START=11 /DNA_END=250 /DNA_ORIENTATION=+
MTNTFKLIAAAALVAATSTAAVAGTPEGVLNTNVENTQGNEVNGTGTGNTDLRNGLLVAGGAAALLLLGGGNGTTTTTP